MTDEVSAAIEGMLGSLDAYSNREPGASLRTAQNFAKQTVEALPSTHREAAVNYMLNVLRNDERNFHGHAINAVTTTMVDTMLELQSAELDKTMEEVNRISQDPAVSEEMKEQASEVLDQGDALVATNEMLADIDGEIEESENDIDQLSQMLSEISALNADDLAKLQEEISKMANAPLSNEGAEKSAYEAVDQNLEAMKAAVAADNARHPIRYAIEQLAASVKAIGEIPKQIKEQRNIAKTAGLDATTSLEKAAKAIASGASGIAAGAISLSERVGNIYKSAVGELSSIWEKAKKNIAKSTAKSVKAVDICMEFLTCGDWSRMYTNKMLDAEAMKTPEGKKEGLRGISQKISAFNLKLHNKLAGIDYQVGQKTAEGIEIGGSAIDYWHDVKSKAFGNQYEGATVGKGDDIRPVKGLFGVNSPADVAAAKNRYIRDKLNEKMDSAKEALADIPGKVAKGAERVAGTIKDTASSVAGMALTGVCAARVGTLRTASKILDKAALVEKSAERRNQNKAEKKYDELASIYKKEAKVEKALDNVKANAPKARQFELSQQEKDLVKAAKASIASEGPTATTVKYLKMMDRRQAKGERNAKAGSVVDKLAYAVKTAGVKIAKNIQLVDLKMDESMAQEAFDKAMDKVAKHGENAAGIDKLSNRLAEKADILANGGYKSGVFAEDVGKIDPKANIALYLGTEGAPGHAAYNISVEDFLSSYKNGDYEEGKSIRGVRGAELGGEVGNLNGKGIDLIATKAGADVDQLAAFLEKNLDRSHEMEAEKQGIELD